MKNGVACSALRRIELPFFPFPPPVPGTLGALAQQGPETFGPETFLWTASSIVFQVPESLDARRRFRHSDRQAFGSISVVTAAQKAFLEGNSLGALGFPGAFALTMVKIAK